MPLKLFPPNGPKQTSWRIRGSYLGKLVERSARTAKRAVAQKILKQIESDIERGTFIEPGEPTFAAAALKYLKARGGISNQHGERECVRKLLQHFGDTNLSHIGQADVDACALALYPKATPATRNRQVYTPVSAIMRESGVTHSLRRPRGSGGKQQTDWLWPEQFYSLRAEAEKLDTEFAALLVTLVYTGMRLSEALGLEWNNVRLQDGYAYVPDTKSGEPRAVFLPPVAVAALANLPHDTKRVFRLVKSGHLYSLLRVAAIKAGVDLPERSAFHIFRHTWASWMRRYCGLDTRGLVATGAWKDSKSAGRYAHCVVTEEAQRAVMLPVERKAG